MDLFSALKSWKRRKRTALSETDFCAAPLRAEVLTVEQLEQFARDLAQRHEISREDQAYPLLERLAENEAVLRDYNLSTAAVSKRRPLTPAAEWLLDNFYLVKEQVLLIRRHLPKTYSRQLPGLSNPLRTPRIYHVILELVAHVDGRVSLESLNRFVSAYQSVKELTLGELWAIPIMLRLGLVENLRRIAGQLTQSRSERDLANHWVDRMIEVGEKSPSDLVLTVSDLARSNPPLTSAFVAEFSRQMQGRGAVLQLARQWLEQRLAENGQSVEDLVRQESQSQAADQLSVGNSITTLRSVASMDWAQFVESISVVEQVLRSDPSDVYARMDFQTRDRYRHVLEGCARHGAVPESTAAKTAIALAAAAPAEDTRARHVGFYFVDRGRETFDKVLHVRAPFTDRFRGWMAKSPLAWYFSGILLLTGLMAGWSLQPAFTFGLHGLGLWGFGGLLVFALVHLAIAIVNWVFTLVIPPVPLPRLDFSHGVPDNHRTIVAVPTLLANLQAVDSLLERLEVHYLANRDKNVFFALLTDLPDAHQPNLLTDEPILRRVHEGVLELNEKYKSDRPGIFFLLHRPRRWNAEEGIWMGWERKRGKLMEFNAVLRGGPADRFSHLVGNIPMLASMRYVVTLDTDTQLPRDAVRQLAGTLGHPLNRPVFDAKRNRVCEGYGILQPRVGVSLGSANRSWFTRLFSGDIGIDPYTRAVSNIYQDLFQEGSFIGKGIYDVEAFERAVGNRFPENTILSHDLIESCHARSALVSDLEVYEEHPSRYTTDISRRHRWIRGDWQISPWLLPRVPGPDARRVENPLSGLSKWKIIDNLRRSLVPVSLVLLLLITWLAPIGPEGFWTVFVAGIVIIPGLLAAAAQSIRKAEDVPWPIHLRSVLISLVRQLGAALLSLVFLPFDAFVSLDAIFRSLVRMGWTKRRRLQWQTASESERLARTDLSSFVRTMWFGPAFALATTSLIASQAPQRFAGSSVLLALWFASPLIAWWISKPISIHDAKLEPSQVLFLKKLARKTWRFFEIFVNEEENWLPPDNFQEHPSPVIASRTSPTNIGLSLVSTLTAFDFGYLSTTQLLDRVTRTFGTLDQLERYRGHFFNWYDTRTLKPLLPLYVSSVDSGNLFAHLLSLRQGLTELPKSLVTRANSFHGIHHTLEVLMEAAAASPPHVYKIPALQSKLNDMQAKLLETISKPPSQTLGCADVLSTLKALSADITALARETGQSEALWWSETLESTIRSHSEELELLVPWVRMPPAPPSLLRRASIHEPGRLNECAAVMDQFNRMPTLAEVAQMEQTFSPLITIALNRMRQEQDATGEDEWLCRLLRSVNEAAQKARHRIQTVEALRGRCSDFVQMDFPFLFDVNRKLFAIGYNASDHRMDNSFYDLLASEARLTSYVAIAHDQVQQEHWFALSRLVVSANGAPVLVSWSGSMFEYLMPVLVMPAPEHTLLGQTCKAAVKHQIAYGKARGIPWGFSESGYNLTDAHLNYQYRAFGVPGLGLKRGLSDDLVVAPYATVLALMTMPREACTNLQRLANEQRQGAYGFYEAIDYTPSRLRPGQRSAVVRSFMAHHQGMSFVALGHLLLDRLMQRRFLADPRLKSAELLLHERIPKSVTPLYPAELEEAGRPDSEEQKQQEMRVFTNPNVPTPEVHLLSNGRYHVVLSAAGGGYSRWNDYLLTRWREDPTRDCWGTFCYVRDLETGEVWSNTYQPTLRVSKLYEAIFTQARAEFRRRTETFDLQTQVSVSPEDDLELRRLVLTNRSKQRKTFELTSYAEVVLAPEAADAAHPAFSNLFVQTHVLREQQAILCTRRPRSENEQSPCLFHMMILHGREAAESSFETDRSVFTGRCNSVQSPQALRATTALSNAEGSVLDPIVSIRRTVRLEPDQSACIDVILGACANLEQARALVTKYQDTSLGERVMDLAWTHSGVVLHQLNATEADAQIFGRLAGSLIYASPLRRARPATIQRNRRGQNALWAYGISGDKPLVVVMMANAAQLDFARQVVQAHAYWRLKGLSTEMVVLTQEDSVYRQSLYDQLIGIVASSTEAHLLDRPGGIFIRRHDQVPEEDRILIQSSARLILSDDAGTLAEQASRRARPQPIIPQLIPTRRQEPEPQLAAAPSPTLQLHNGYGGFSADGREYVIAVTAKQNTPAPWVNILANPEFGSVLSETGGAYTWLENSHEFRLTPWFNDPVTDPAGEAFYIRDEESGQFWSPTPQPARGHQPYTVRHGFGYTVFEHAETGISTELTQFVAMDAPIKLIVISIRNHSGRTRRLSAIGYFEWLLGELRHRSMMHVVTEQDALTGAILAHNAFNTDFSGRIAFAETHAEGRTCTADRTEFIGRNRSLADPASLHRLRLSGAIGAGLDPCAAFQIPVELANDQECQVIFRLGAGHNLEEVHGILKRFWNAQDVQRALETTKDYWGRTLGVFQIKTPEPSFDVLANGWALYQVLACRMWARSGFYQSGGAFGFRDQLQDSLALLHCEPRLVREHLLRAAAHQFLEGDVQHWWHPPVGRGVRTHCSDDYLWLPYAVCRYVEAVDDTSVLAEIIPFLEGPLVKAGEEAYYELPAVSSISATLYEHCARAIKRGLQFGIHGLPLMGSGDWNDGMNRVGHEGKGESVWLAFFLYDVLVRFAALAARQNDLPFAGQCNKAAEQLRANIEKHAWDGGWYRRAWFDDGTPLGSQQNAECRIDSLPQSWATISGAADRGRAHQALEAVEHHLVRREPQLIAVLDPPFDKSALNPGYIKGYVPGVRENGGQYTHAAVWAVLAFAAAGEHARAWEFFNLINPVNHARTPASVEKYKLEPYVMAGDVYSASGHEGRGGWSWYTGAAGWTYQVIIERLLGIVIKGGQMRCHPRLPLEWKDINVEYRHHSTVYNLRMHSKAGWGTPVQVVVDGVIQPELTLRLKEDGHRHEVDIFF